ncbi:hypothetical protein AB0D10_37595 [Kitasatospora sp. NPDC048545]|uniref:hypothetical protein n=1 Tax=Kitasatospora sp. NPDC048545 TaxID=3157208 RepID=UPI0034016A57
MPVLGGATCRSGCTEYRVLRATAPVPTSPPADENLVAHLHDLGADRYRLVPAPAAEPQRQQR